MTTRFAKPGVPAFLGASLTLVLLAGISLASASAAGVRAHHKSPPATKKYVVSEIKKLSHGLSVKNSTELGGQTAAHFQTRAMWAYVNADGSIARQSGGITSVSHDAVDPGMTGLLFPTSLVGYAISVTPHLEGNGPGHASAGFCGDTEVGTPPVGALDCTESGPNTTEELLVWTSDYTNTEADMGFYVLVLR